MPLQTGGFLCLYKSSFGLEEIKSIIRKKIMKKINNRGILLGAGLLGATTLIGVTSPASAQPGQRRDVRDARQDVKEARQDVRQERKDVRQADTARERRDAKEDLRDAKRDLKDEKRDLRNERQDVRNSNRYNTPNRYNPPVYNRPVYGAPAYNRPTYNRPVYNAPVYNRPVFQNSTRVLEGVVTNDTAGNDFVLRTSNGQQVRVYVQTGEPGALSRGDTVRVSGYSSNGIFYAQNTRILYNR